MSVDEFAFHDREIFDAALEGDETGLRRAAGPDGVFCLDPSAGVDRVTELLPHARRLVADIAGVRDRARDLMWRPARTVPSRRKPGRTLRLGGAAQPPDSVPFR